MKQKTNECRICGLQEDSRLEVLEHLTDDHTLAERQAALVDRVQRQEVDTR